MAAKVVRCCGIDVREWDYVRVSGEDSDGYDHVALLGVVGTVDTGGWDPVLDEEIKPAIKVWPDDPRAGDGGGKIWFCIEDVRELTLLAREEA